MAGTFTPAAPDPPKIRGRKGTFSPLALLTLPRTRRMASRRAGRFLVVGIGLVYATISMLVGQLLQFYPISGTSFYWVVVPVGSPAWDYPALTIAGPNFTFGLPLLPTLLMILVAAGVGIGMTASVLLLVRFLQVRRTGLGRTTIAAGATGLTPATMGLVMVGACCSTTAASTAGIALVASATGTTVSALLVGSWFPGVFQLVVLYVALLAQEQLIALYETLLDPRVEETARAPSAPAVPSRKFVLGAALRTGLVAGGVTWSLTTLAAWAGSAPPAITAGVLFQWIFQHQLIALTAIGVAMFPWGAYRAIVQGAPRISPNPSGIFRGALGVAAATLLAWMPPPFPSWGIVGFGNELVGALGVSGAFGGVAPVLPLGAELYLRWGFQFLLLGFFGLALAISPSKAIRPTLWSSARAEISPTGAREELSDRFEAPASEMSTAPIPGPAAGPAPPAPVDR